MCVTVCIDENYLPIREDGKIHPLQEDGKKYPLKNYVRCGWLHKTNFPKSEDASETLKSWKPKGKDGPVGRNESVLCKYSEICFECSQTHEFLAHGRVQCRVVWLEEAQARLKTWCS